MAINKTEIFPESDIQLAKWAKSLSHPARISILRTLAQRKSCICGEIVEVLPLAQATVSQHLKELKSVGLIKGEVEGKKSCYCINWESINAFNSHFAGFMQELLEYQPKNKCC